jgi:alcohol dehydrogenase, propanol-preferring
MFTLSSPSSLPTPAGLSYSSPGTHPLTTTLLGHLGIQYALAMGLRVLAIVRSPEQGSLCTTLGAEVYIDSKANPDVPAAVMRITTHGAHAAVVYAASKAAYELAPLLLRPGGTVVAVGLPHDPTVIAGASPNLLATKRLNIAGSVTGTLKDVEEALDFTKRDLVHPILTKGTLADVDKFCALMNEGKLKGRGVLRVAA